VVLKPVNGLLVNSSNNIIPIVSGQSTRIGHTGGVFNTGGLIFQQPDLSGARITSMMLRLRFETQTLLNGTGRLEVGGFVFNSVNDYRVSTEFTRTGMTGSAQYINIDVVREAELFTHFPSNIAYSIGFYPSNTSNGFLHCNYSLCELRVGYQTFEPRTPDTLQPNGGVNRHPNSEIQLSWRFNRNSSAPRDEQQRSVLQYRVNSGNWQQLNLPNINNSHMFAPGSFASGNSVTWRVQTVSNLGTSEFSEIASFVLASTPPLAPLLVYPVNVAVEAASGALLEWRYNSQYDLRASRFDVRYRISGGNWVNRITNGVTSLLTESITGQSTVEWQVRATGQLGDLGPWSDVAAFWVIGTPQTPVIVAVSSINRPVVTFSAVNAMSWEMMFYNANGDVWSETGDVAFDGSFTYKTEILFPDGNYSVKMRIRNEYGLYSGWAALAFSVSGKFVPDIKLNIVDNNRIGIKLINRIMYDLKTEFYKLEVFRSNAGTDEYIQIEQIMLDKHYKQFDRFIECVYTDFTASPGIKYTYFTRLIENEGNGYSESDKADALVDFNETIIFIKDRPEKLIALTMLAPGEEPKAAEVSRDKVLTKLIGRKRPVTEIGSCESRVLFLSYLCNMLDYEMLTEFALSDGILCLCDRRFGSAFGIISGKVRSVAAEPGYVIVNFVFVETETN